MNNKEVLDCTETKQPLNVREKITKWIENIFDVGKKIADVCDDAWNLCRGFISLHIIERVGPFLVGSVGFLIHLGEGFKAATEGYAAYRDKATPQRYTKLAKSAFAAACATSGFSLSIAYIAKGLGVFVLGASFFPAIIPGLLTCIYTANLMSSIYTLKVSLAEEKALSNDLERTRLARQKLRDQLAYLKKEKKRVAELLTKAHKDKTPTDKITLLQSQLNQQETTCEQNLVLVEKKCTQIQAQLTEARESLFEAKREVAFDTVEVLTSAAVLAGIILSSGAIVALFAGGSVATFGALPIALLVIGVSIAFASKVFDKVDERHGHRFTKKIHEKLSQLFSFHKPKLEPASQLKKTDELESTTATLFTKAPALKNGAQTNTTVAQDVPDFPAGPPNDQIELTPKPSIPNFGGDHLQTVKCSV